MASDETNRHGIIRVYSYGSRYINIANQSGRMPIEVTSDVKPVMSVELDR